MSGPGPHVLIVDDYEDSRALCTEYLQFMGYRVSSAADGREAVRKASAQPDVIIMDLSLPQMDGWQAIRALKDDVVTRNIPVIVLTGHALSGLRERALEAGCAGFLTKPCLPPDLLEEVQRAIGAPEVASAPAPKKKKKTRPTARSKAKRPRKA
jgi:CheY-like chemotaxis protein